MHAMSLEARSTHPLRNDKRDFDSTPPKHDARWTLGISRHDRAAEPADRPGRHLDFDARATVIDEGDEARAVYLILEGAVMLSKLLPDGRRQIIELLGSGDVFGLTTTRQHDVCAETLTHAKIVSYDRATVEGSLPVQAMIAERLKAQMCALHDHAVLLGRKSAIERVATFLMRLVPDRGGHGCIGPGAKDQASVRVPLTRQEIADYLGLTLETVSRAFSHLRREGLLIYGRHDDVMIANVCKLCRVTGSH
jgi:CRP/FNR family nitrogen fixation transcriptional regulator